MPSNLQTIGQHLTQVTNESLLAQYVNGDFTAFEQLYQRNKGGVYRYLLRQVHDTSLVDDLFQDIWAKVVTHASTYQQSASFTTWLYTIARHKVIDHVRHVQVVNKVIDSQTEADVQGVNENEHMATQVLAPENAHHQLLQAQAIEHCMQKLPAHQLDCFLLREEAGLSAPLIAQVVNINLEAAKSRLKAAYKLLRTCLSLQLELDAAQSKNQEKGNINE